jgi:hypothetical protein
LTNTKPRAKYGDWRAAREFRWRFVFGSAVSRPDREMVRMVRWYAHPVAVDRSVKQAADIARIGVETEDEIQTADSLTVKAVGSTHAE